MFVFAQVFGPVSNAELCESVFLLYINIKEEKARLAVKGWLKRKGKGK